MEKERLEKNSTSSEPVTSHKRKRMDDRQSESSTKRSKLQEAPNDPVSATPKVDPLKKDLEPLREEEKIFKDPSLPARLRWDSFSRWVELIKCKREEKRGLRHELRKRRSATNTRRRPVGKVDLLSNVSTNQSVYGSIRGAVVAPGQGTSGQPVDQPAGARAAAIQGSVEQDQSSTIEARRQSVYGTQDAQRSHEPSCLPPQTQPPLIPVSSARPASKSLEMGNSTSIPNSPSSTATTLSNASGTKNTDTHSQLSCGPVVRQTLCDEDTTLVSSEEDHAASASGKKNTDTASQAPCSPATRQTASDEELTSVSSEEDHAVIEEEDFRPCSLTPNVADTSGKKTTDTPSLSFSRSTTGQAISDKEPTSVYSEEDHPTTHQEGIPLSYQSRALQENASVSHDASTASGLPSNTGKRKRTEDHQPQPRKYVTSQLPETQRLILTRLQKDHTRKRNWRDRLLRADHERSPGSMFIPT